MRDTRPVSNVRFCERGDLRSDKLLMRDPAKGRVWWIAVVLILMIAATLFVNRWMQQ